MEHKYGPDFLVRNTDEIKKTIAETDDRDELEKILLAITIVGSGLKLKMSQAREYVSTFGPVIDAIDGLHASATRRRDELANTGLEAQRDRLLEGLRVSEATP